MPLYNQGENYEEDIEETVEETVVEEPQEEEEEEKPTKKKKKQRSAPKPLIIASIVGSCVILIIVAVVGVSMGNARKEAEEKRKQDEIFEKLLADQEYYEDNPEVTQPVVVETEAVSLSSTTYSSDELRALRKWGYTASELDIAARDGLSAKALVDSARADREEAQKEALAAVSDTASPEYQKLLNQTWLGGEPLDISAFTADGLFYNEERTEIVDYEKCDPHNQQLFIKVYLDNGHSAFFTVEPLRYQELPDSGNMVVAITEAVRGDTRVIVKIEEQRVN